MKNPVHFRSDLACRMPSKTGLEEELATPGLGSNLEVDGADSGSAGLGTFSGLSFENFQLQMLGTFCMPMSSALSHA